MKKLAFVLVILLAAAGFAWWSVSTPYRGFAAEATVDIPHGAGTYQIASTLAGAGVIRSTWPFLLTRAFNRHAKLQAGEYRFTSATTVGDVFDKIARGDIYFFEFTVPEGSNIFDIGHLLETHGIFKADAFVDAASNPALIQSLLPGLAPHAKTLEGFLFPSTYRMTHTTTVAQLCKLMTSEFREEWTRLTASSNTPPDLNATVTLASLIEKETGAPAERPMIASVFENRLHKNMRLQCDPTTIYAALLENKYHGKIHQSDLARTNPYNTYQSDGLPPGPIANPGTDSLTAALHPENTNYLYFVAKPEGGGHNFSTTLAAHGQAVAQYRHAGKK